MFQTQITAPETMKKAPFFGAFFVCLALMSGVSCAEQQQAKVKYVVDGDTFVLTSGDKVRMVGINTPELGHGKFPDEPLANRAKRFLEEQIKGRSVSLQFGAEKADKYGRLLARVQNDQGEDMQLALLRQGLAVAIAVGENLEGIDALLAAENEARADDKGVWGYKHYDAIKLDRGMPKKKGYQRIIGKVKRISDSRKYKTLWLTDRFRVLIPFKNWRQYWSGNDKNLKGKIIEARGWVFKSKGTGGMKVYHPSMAKTVSVQ